VVVCINNCGEASKDSKIIKGKIGYYPS